MLEQLARHSDPIHQLWHRFVEVPEQRRQELRQLRSEVSDLVNKIGNMDPNWKDGRERGIKYQFPFQYRKPISEVSPILAGLFPEGYTGIDTVLTTVSNDRDFHTTGVEIGSMRDSDPSQIHRVELSFDKRTHRVSISASHFSGVLFIESPSIGEKEGLQAMKAASEFVLDLFKQE